MTRGVESPSGTYPSDSQTSSGTTASGKHPWSQSDPREEMESGWTASNARGVSIRLLPLALSALWLEGSLLRGCVRCTGLVGLTRRGKRLRCE